MYFKKTLYYDMDQRYGHVLREEIKLQAAEKKLPRAIVGKAMRERIRNTYISGELKIEEEQKQMKINRLRWFGHI
jgi:hypothetical protein